MVQRRPTSATTVISERNGLPVVRTEETEYVDRVLPASDRVRLPPKVVAQHAVNIPHKIYQTTFIEGPRPEKEVITKVNRYEPRYVYRELPPDEKFVEVVEYHTLPIHHTQEVEIVREEFQDEVTLVPDERVVEVKRPIDLNVAVPELCERVTQYEITVPKIVPVYRDITIPIYVPRIIESSPFKLSQGGERHSSRSDELDAEKLGLQLPSVNTGGQWSQEAAHAFVLQAFAAVNDVPPRHTTVAGLTAPRAL